MGRFLLQLRSNGLMLSLVLLFWPACGWEPAPNSRFRYSKIQKHEQQPVAAKPGHSSMKRTLRLFHAATPDTDDTVSASEHECGIAKKSDVKGQESNARSQNNLVPSTTFNLIKAMIGSGVLALPSGVAAHSDYKTA